MEVVGSGSSQKNKVRSEAGSGGQQAEGLRQGDWWTLRLVWSHHQASQSRLPLPV